MCQICKCSRVKYSVSKDQPRQLIACVVKSAELSIKDAAKQKSEVLYNEVKSVDLIAKEFRCHRICYKKLTKMKQTNNLLKVKINPSICLLKNSNFSIKTSND